jgi:hypothetical protein
MSRPEIPNLRTWPRNLGTSQGGGLSTSQYGGMSTSQYCGASTNLTQINKAVVCRLREAVRRYSDLEQNFGRGTSSSAIYPGNWTLPLNRMLALTSFQAGWSPRPKFTRL